MIRLFVVVYWPINANAGISVMIYVCKSWQKLDSILNVFQDIYWDVRINDIMFCIYIGANKYMFRSIIHDDIHLYISNGHTRVDEQKENGNKQSSYKYMQVNTYFWQCMFLNLGSLYVILTWIGTCARVHDKQPQIISTDKSSQSRTNAASAFKRKWSIITTLSPALRLQ